jgi:hypothetical protein
MLFLPLRDVVIQFSYDFNGLICGVVLAKTSVIQRQRWFQSPNPNWDRREASLSGSHIHLLVAADDVSGSDLSRATNALVCSDGSPQTRRIMHRNGKTRVLCLVTAILGR